MNKYQCKHLKQLVIDCITFRLSEKEGLEYIQESLGTQISSRHYYRVKNNVSSEKYHQDWLENHTKIGFLVEFKKRIEEMEKLQKICINFLRKECKKDETLHDKGWIIQIFNQITKNNIRLSELYLAAPIVENIKKRLDDAASISRISDQSKGYPDAIFK